MPQGFVVLMHGLLVIHICLIARKLRGKILNWVHFAMLKSANLILNNLFGLLTTNSLLKILPLVKTLKFSLAK